MIGGASDPESVNRLFDDCLGQQGGDLLECEFGAGLAI
jgi:hypothetical protein